MHYVWLVEIIRKLESLKLTLQQSLTLQKEAETKISEVLNKKVKDKFAAAFGKNIGLKPLSAIANNDTEERLKFDQFKQMSPSQLASFKYATIVSYEVERSFGVFKSVRTEKRRKFTVSTLIMHLIIAFYNNKINEK